jgi:hypothetical protein
MVWSQQQQRGGGLVKNLAAWRNLLARPVLTAVATLAVLVVGLFVVVAAITALAPR